MFKDFAWLCCGAYGRLGRSLCDPCVGGECSSCNEAFDRWEAEAPEREQRKRERLDADGYYDPEPSNG